MRNTLEQLAPIILGWLFGLLTPGIAERIRRPYRRRDLMHAVIDEMLGLQHTMAVCAYEQARWITGQVIYVDGGASLMTPEVPQEIHLV